MNAGVRRNSKIFRVGINVFNRHLGIGKIVGEYWAEGNYYWQVEYANSETGENFTANTLEANLYPLISRCFKCNKKHDASKSNDFRVTANTRKTICKSCITNIKDVYL